jgi:outer membrane protein assembly factor BamE
MRLSSRCSRRFLDAMRTLLTSALLVATLAGCSSVSDFLSPYRIDVRQGNFVSQEMVAQLKPGMSREQVRLSSAHRC